MILIYQCVAADWNSDEVEQAMSQAHKEWQDGHDAAVKRIHLLEAQLVIWRQIEESKSELLQWLSETSGGLTVSRGSNHFDGLLRS